MTKLLTLIGLMILLGSCSTNKKLSQNLPPENEEPILIDSNTFYISEISKNKSYGLTPKNPVEVGESSSSSWQQNERRYLNALAGPNGERLAYYHAGSCCPIKSDKAIFGNSVMLDRYRVTWEGSSDTVSIYINMFDSGELKAPLGFNIKK